MSFVEALVLGIVQGLTEFLPVSSSGHIELGTFLFNIQSKDNLLFSIAVHGATSLSTIWVFRKDVALLIRESLRFQWNPQTKFVLQILFSALPVVVLGLFFMDEVESLFGINIVLVGSMLILTGVFLSLTRLAGKSHGEITFAKALLIGFAQAVAVIPGISRSGATITTALLLGVKKETATRFSFLMVLFPILGATGLEVLKIIKNPVLTDGISLAALGIGFVAAFLSGLVACIWIIQIVKRGKLIYFAVYCFLIGSIAILSNLL
jgi:undecaprenyl-diphosphatase